MLARRLGLAIALLAGLIGSQGPEFAQQYRQRLGGPLEELNWIVSEFDAEVRGQNLTPAEALKRLEGNSDLLARERGEDMGKAIARADHLNEQLQAMNSAGPPMRLYVVATRFDSELARSALDNYEPAEPLSIGALRPAVSPRFADGRRCASSPGPSAAAPAFARRAREPRGARQASTYVNSSMAGLMASIEGVSPAMLRLSPCVSEIVRPDEVLVA